MSDKVDPKELLTRFLTSRNHYSPHNRRVKYGAFMPPSDLRLSVFRVEGLSNVEIWEIGEKNVVQKSEKTLHGRAEIKTIEVTEKGLSVDPDNNPPRHASIIGWYQDKGKQKLIAMELAAEAALELRGKSG
jgi:hypothetical protein